MATPPFYKTSFDCAKAKELSIEEAICKNQELAKLDAESAEAYRERLGAGNASEKEQVIASQRRWLTIRNAHNVNPYYGDPTGELADLSEFYKERIAALRSGNPDLLKTAIPEEYAWLRRTAPEGFSKDEFSIGRAYASCEDPCQKKPSLYRWISIGGGGIGEAPGDIDTPYTQLAGKLASEGWIECRSADDSGKPTVDYFTKGNKLVSVSRYYSMGVGNGIGVGITISDPLPQSPPKAPPNPAVTVTNDWITYSNPDVGLQVQYPPRWHMRDDSPGDNIPYKSLRFGADDYTANFTITMKEHGLGWPYDDRDAAKCFSSRYRISGLPAIACVVEGESVADGICTRYLRSVDVDAGKYRVRFEPSGVGSFGDDSGQYTLTDLYEKIMSTIELKKPN